VMAQRRRRGQSLGYLNLLAFLGYGYII
jgi:hypothetical protein